MTLSARKTLMALPHSPKPPDLFEIFSTRLSTMSVPSSPGVERQTRMPPLPAPLMVLALMRSPRASIEKMAISPAAIVLRLLRRQPTQEKFRCGPRRQFRNQRCARSGLG
jgi:hypothetical protein